MPYRNRQNRAEYMKRYREFKKGQLQRAMRALEQGNAPRARRILTRRPNIHIRRRRRRR